MRHRVAHRKLGRVTEHRIALLRNQAEALIRHERIETTVPKAKELRPFVERLITVAKRGLADGPKTTKALHARRIVAADVHKPETVDKLFDTIAPRFAARPGGYTRILHMAVRAGDNADMALMALVDRAAPAVEAPAADAGEKKPKARKKKAADAAPAAAGDEPVKKPRAPRKKKAAAAA